MPVSRPNFCPNYTRALRIWRAARHPKNATNSYTHARDSRFGPPPNPPWPTIAPPGLLRTVGRLYSTKNLVDVQSRHYSPKTLKISNPFF